MSAKAWLVHFVMAASLAAHLTPRVGSAAQDADEVAEATAMSHRDQKPFKTLSQRIAAVTHRMVTKAGRTEVSVDLGLSLTEPFFRYVAPELRARYHFDEMWALGALVEYDAAITTPLNIVARANSAALPDLNHANLAVGIEAVLAPIYGKINWLAESVSHFDTYASVGVGFMALHRGGTVSGSFAIGQHYFINPLTAFKIEIREQLYTMARDPRVGSATRLESLLMASVGISFFVPKVGAFGQP